jgi:hypothetical protein
MLRRERVERTHQTIEISDDVFRRQILRRRREVDEVGEHHAQIVDAIRDARLARLEPRRDRGRHHGGDERLGAFVLLLQLHLGAIQQSERIEYERRIDDGYTHDRLVRHQFAQPGVFG